MMNRNLITLAVTTALIASFLLTYQSVERGNIYGPVAVGNWTTWPKSTRADTHPYMLARQARSGRAFLGPGEGITFFATRDREGKEISGTCSYQLTGKIPAARLWTITVSDAQRNLISNPSTRYGLHSREVFSVVDGQIDLRISRNPTPGNWLPSQFDGPIVLILRLYDTPISSATNLSHIELPSIIRGRCQ